jgi:hypothetical protein
MNMTPTRQKWFDVVDRWKASGLNAAAFAEREGAPVTERRLMRWRWKAKKLRGEEGTATPTFVRLEPAPTLEPSAATLEVVSTTGRVVRVPAGFDAATLTRLLVVVDGGAR